MKKMLCRLVPAILIAGLPALAFAEGSVDSTTIMRFQQEAQSPVPDSGTRGLAPLTEFLGVDYSSGNFSVHAYGWGTAQLGDPKPTTDGNETLQGSLNYGYLQYRFDQANARARAGRIFINEGVVNEQVDGASFRTDLPYGFGFSAFGGATVHTINIPHANSDGKGDGIAGGRLNYRLAGKLELGLSGVTESKRPVQPTGTPTVLQGAYGSHRLIGADVWLSPLNMVQLSGHSSYNTQTDRFAEHSYLLQLTPLKNLVLAGSYDHHRDRDYFYSSALFSGTDFLKNLSQESRVLGGSATYTIQKVEISCDFKDYRRDIGEAERFGGELRGYFADNSVRSGFGYHYLRAGSEFAVVPNVPNTSGSFHELRGWAMHETKGYFASLDLIGYLFDKPVENRDSAWEAQGSLGYHLTTDLALSGDLSYGQNPQYRDDFKGLVRLTYNLTAGKGATK